MPSDAPSIGEEVMASAAEVTSHPHRSMGQRIWNSRRAIPLVISAGGFAAVWIVLSRQEAWWPSLADLRERGAELLWSAETLEVVWLSTRRLLIGLGAAALFAIGAVGLAERRWWRPFVQFYVVIALSLPSMIIALLGLIILGTSETGVYLVVGIIAFPHLFVALEQGVKGLDPGLQEMARVYRFTRGGVIRHLIFPGLVPYFLGGLRNAYALGWKVLVLAELFAVQSGIGFEVQRAFDFFIITDLFIWVGVLITLVLATEYAFIGVLERRLLRWRR